MIKPRGVSACAIALGLVLCGAASAVEVGWAAATGMLPTTACPPWTAAGTGATMGDGALVIDTPSCGVNMSYWQGDLAIPETLVVEARVRVTASASCQSCGLSYRRGANLLVTVAPSVGTLLQIGVDQVLLTTTSECGGQVSATVDTDGDFHVYRLAITGSAVQLSYDGSPILSSSTYYSLSDHAGAPRILWGEGSSLASGHSEWSWVRHNAHASGCPTSGSGLPDHADVQLHQCRPNPFNPRTAIAFELPAEAAVRLEVFDLAGNRLCSLVDGVLPAGTHEATWDGRDSRGRAQPSGHYLARLEAGAASRSITMSLVR